MQCAIFLSNVEHLLQPLSRKGWFANILLGVRGCEAKLVVNLACSASACRNNFKRDADFRLSEMGPIRRQMRTSHEQVQTKTQTNAKSRNYTTFSTSLLRPPSCNVTSTRTLVAQCSATPATVAATLPCSATPFQTQISVRHLPGQGGGARHKIFRGCSAAPVLHLQML